MKEALIALTFLAFLEKRLFESSGLPAVNSAKLIYQEALRLEKVDIQLAISGGEGYETIWERKQAN